jgi:TetR/AcrR family transcriptional repressor of nem operon
MRRSRAEAAETREQILETASQLLRRQGVAGTGVAQVMAAAGLTHGGFYKHFPSKEALVAEAIQAGLANTQGGLRRQAEATADEDRLRAILDAYLGMAHRDAPEQGCAIAALGPEAARSGDDARHAVTEGVRNLADIVAGALDRQDEEHGAESRAVVAAMVGALILSRIVDDPDLSEAFLADTRRYLLARETEE